MRHRLSDVSLHALSLVVCTPYPLVVLSGIILVLQASHESVNTINWGRDKHAGKALTLLYVPVYYGGNYNGLYKTSLHGIPIVMLIN